VPIGTKVPFHTIHRVFNGHGWAPKRVEARQSAGPERLTPRQVEKFGRILSGRIDLKPRLCAPGLWKKSLVPRAIWSGVISFGLVSVPVRMYTATESKELKFHFLDRRDMAPIGYDKVNKTTGESVPPEEIIRGFEVAKGRFVELEDDDIDRLDVELTHAIDICDFVSIDEIDPLYFRKGYYLLPQEGAEKPYRLLVKALEETGRVAIAKVVIRNKQHLAAVRPVNDTLVLETMYYADEVRQPEEAPKPQVRGPEIEMAKTLIENLAAKWDPEKYHDRYRNELLDLLEKKAKGKPLPEPSAEEGGEVVDLMEALRRSVAATKKKQAAPTRRKTSGAKKKTSARRKTASRKAS
jgi:DNA end-binding protein Ku